MEDVVFIPGPRFARAGRTNGEGGHQVVGSSGWAGSCGGGRYKRRVSGCGRVMVYCIQPLKMELIEGSETSANHNRTPGKYPKEYIQDSKHGESLKSII